MTHFRERQLNPKLKKLFSQSPSVCLLGMRQTGKTTLLTKLSASYFTLDDDGTLAAFRDGDWGTLDQAKTPVALDECQKLPALFDHIKLMIDQKKERGRFLLTGSVRFLSKKQIKESLTGRTLILELLPLTLSEAHSNSQRNVIEEIARHKDFSAFIKSAEKNVWTNLQQIEHHIEMGGLPGICFRRDKNLRASLHEQQIETLLSRDLPMLYASRVSLPTLKELLRLIAIKQGEKPSFLSLAKHLRISAPTVRSLLIAFEGLFILRSLDGRYYFEDSGMLNHLMHQDYQSKKNSHEGFIFRELIALIRYQYFSNAELSSYSTRGGVDIPFVVSVNQKPVCAITFDPAETVSERSLKSLGKIKKLKPTCKGIALFLGYRPYEASNGVWCLPLHWFV